MANGLSAETASGYGDSDTRKRKFRELLNFFPVIGEDEGGEMIDNVSSRLTSFLFSNADKEATNLEERLTKKNKKKAEIHIRKAINEEIGSISSAK